MEASTEVQELARLHDRIGTLATRLGWIAIFLMLLVAWRVYTTFAPAAYGNVPTPRVEYRVESFGEQEWTSTASGPNRLGAEGWEIIYVRRAETGSNVSYECILRRRR